MPARENYSVCARDLPLWLLELTIEVGNRVVSTVIRYVRNGAVVDHQTGTGRYDPQFLDVLRQSIARMAQGHAVNRHRARCRNASQGRAAQVFAMVGMHSFEDAVDLAIP